MLFEIRPILFLLQAEALFVKHVKIGYDLAYMKAYIAFACETFGEKGGFMKTNFVRRCISIMLVSAIGLSVVHMPVVAMATQNDVSINAMIKDSDNGKEDDITYGGTDEVLEKTIKNASGDLIISEPDSFVETDSVITEPGPWVATQEYVAKQNTEALNARSGARAMQIDPSNLTDWVTYDHYWQGTILTTQQTKNNSRFNNAISSTGWGPPYMPPVTDPPGWNDAGGMNEHGNHPFYYMQNEYVTSLDRSDNLSIGNKKVKFYDVTYDHSNQAQKDQLYNEVLSVRDASSEGKWDGTRWQGQTPATNYVSQHIYAEGTRDNASITMLGYSSGYYTDFALAPINTNDLKTVGFDVDCSEINDHTLNSFGFLLNAGVKADKKLYGYALVFSKNDATGLGTVYLVDISDGYDVDTLHGVYVNNKSQVSTDTEFLLVGSLPSKVLGTIDMSSGKLRVDMAVRSNEVTFQVGRYQGNNVITSTDKELDGSTPVTLATNTGETSFGPIASYTGDGHFCDRLSWIGYRFLQMSVGYRVMFHGNYPGQAAGAEDVVDDYDNIPAVDALGNPATYSLNELSMSGALGAAVFPPVTPSHAGYSFVGWSTNKDEIGATRQYEYDFDSKVDKITHVYAIWQKLDIEITNYTPATWTNTDVTGTVVIHSDQMPTNVFVTVNNGGTPIQLPVHGIIQTGTGEYTGTFVAQTNIASGSTVDADAYDGSGTAQAVTNVAEIAWIDKLAPVVNGMPADNAGTAGTSVTVDDAAATADYGKSGIATVTYNAVEKDGTAYTSTTSWTDLLGKMKTGVYDVTVTATDVAGNTTTKSAKDLGHVDPADSVKLNVVYNPTTWTNKDVEATVTIKSSLPLAKVTIGGTDVTTSVVAGAAGTYTVKHTFTKNESKAIVVETAVASYGATDTLKVDWIDKLAPVVNGMPADNAGTAGTSVTVDDAAATADYGKSGIATVTYNAVEKDGTAYTSTTSWTDLLSKMKTGVYDVTVTAKDVAGNTTTKSAKDLAHADFKDSVKLDVVYNPTTWTNKDVEATVTIKSSLPLTKVTIGGIDVTTNVVAGAAGTYTVKHTFTKNESKTIVVETAVASYKATDTLKVSWIDTIAPTFSNFPDVTAVGSVLDAAKVKTITFTDTATNASLGSKTESGVDDATRAIALYEVVGGKVSATPTKTIKWADLDAQWTTIKEGKYYYDVVAADVATNIGKASDNGGLRGGGEPDPINPINPDDPDPVNPDNPPIIINPTAPMIEITGISPSGPTNQQVTVSFKATSKYGITSIDIKNSKGTVVYSKPNSATGYGLNVTDTFVTSINSTFTATVVDTSTLTGSDTKAVNNIDKYKPLITVTPASEKDVSKISVNITDDTTVADDNSPSGVDDSKTLYTAIYYGYEFSGDTIANATKTIPTGAAIDLRIEAKDKAGNEAKTTITGLTNGSIEPELVVTITNEGTLKNLKLNSKILFVGSYGSGTYNLTVKNSSGTPVATFANLASGQQYSKSMADLGMTGLGTYTLEFTAGLDKKVKYIAIRK